MKNRWLLYLIAASAFVSVWAGWVGLGEMTGFGEIQLLPGIWDDLKVNTAVTLPLGMEAYGVLAMSAWLSTEIPARAKTFALVSSLVSLTIGAGGQVLFHVLSPADTLKAPLAVTVFVSTLPVLVLGLATTLVHLTGHKDMPVTRDVLDVSTQEEAAVQDEDTDAKPDQEGTTPWDRARVEATDRLSRLVQLRTTNPDITNAELAEALGVSTKTVQRDLKRVG